MPVSPGRSGFGPQLALAYDSGAGNGPFGLGWNLSLPTITRKTDKGLPLYHDGHGNTADSDVFILSGAEDLVPLLRPDGTIEETVRDGCWVRQYRPRIEGLFARIERWLSQTNPTDISWRSISKDNITTVYGKTAESRIFDPDNETQIFSWLICQSYDDKGNAIVYRYAAEDDAGVDLRQANERNRMRTAQRYLTRIVYGNRTPNRHADGAVIDPATLPATTWMFEVVFDYGEGHLSAPQTAPDQPQFVTAALALPPAARWPVRLDPFSSYRSGFEVRTSRLCRRVLMFHHFPDELGLADCLVRSTEFGYREDPVASFITTVTQSGYVRQPAPGEPNRYLRSSLPPLSCTYSQVPSPEELAGRPIQEVDTESLENLPVGLDSALYQWVDLDGDGVAGLLTEQGDGWFYKRNLSPLPLEGEASITARFAPVERVATRPAGGLRGGQAQFLDLAGDGQPDLVIMDGPLRGFFERTPDEGWELFRTFRSWPNLDTRDPNLKFIDLDGDGHADILISEQGAFVWHPSLGEDGFGAALRTPQSWDEERGPRLVFADGSQSIVLADLSGDGLTDLVRIRNGEVCYWPNQGYGRFGPKVTMDCAPWFDAPELFDQKRIRLADIDGSGATDLIYLRSDGSVQVFFNQAGNAWSVGQTLHTFPPIDNLAAVQVLDLLGNGTACLVWSSPLPGASGRQLRYLDLMDGQKPHLLIKVINNLGAETVVRYAPSTRFYLEDRQQGQPWLTRLPFPVHVVERVETYDRVSRNRFVSRYAYHHGFFDGVEREFRGFALVEQWDTEEIGSVPADQSASDATNLDAASLVPPVHTKSWFHTGMYLGRERVSNFFATLIDPHRPDGFYREPGWSNADAQRALLPDTVLPAGLTLEEEREACRALKGMLLRQEVYGRDGTDQAQHPYSVTEQNFTIERLQPQGQNRHAVFFSHPREALSFHYERNPADPRIGHTLTLEVDAYGNVLKSVAIGYGRRVSPLEQQPDRERQTGTLITYTETTVTQAVNDPETYRAPLPAESRTYELTGYALADGAVRFQAADFVQPDQDGALQLVSDGPLPYEQPATTGRQHRLIEQVRTRYRSDDLTALLPLGQVGRLALPGAAYKLAFTPGLLAQVFVRDGQALLPDPAAVLAGQATDQGGYVDLDGDGHWWIPSGRVFFSATDLPAQAELSEARAHFFLPRRFSDPFGQSGVATYDAHDLLAIQTEDMLQNTVVAEHDYRVLQPRRLTDPNGNRSEAAFDTLGMVVGTAVMGKVAPAPAEGDTLAGFVPDLTPQQLAAYFDADDPRPLAVAHLNGATTRIIYDLSRVPACAATIARVTHVSELAPGLQSEVQLSFSYSDGFGREVQKKIQAEPGLVPQRDADGSILVGSDGQPVLTAQSVSPRWVGSGWTVFNNKGKPVRQFKPFFSDTHRLDADTRIGVSPWLFYDPAGRVVATLHPNHTWEKVVFDPWQQATYDVNDTVLLANATTNPALDPDVGSCFARLPAAEYLPTWYEQRVGLGSNDPEGRAAEQTAIHAQTPSVAHLDALGRPFLTVAHNRFERNGAQVEEHYATRVELDIEGNQRAVRDALVQNGDQQGRVVMRYAYDMLGSRVSQLSMEAGARWTLADVTGKPIRAWDSRGFTRRMTYDALRRPTGLFVSAGGPERLAERTVYGEGQGTAANHRTRVYQVYDGAGVVTSEAYDFKGHLRASRRDLLPDYKSAVDWQLEPAADDGSFTSSTRYDALGRPLSVTTPDGSVYRPTFNEANLLDQVEVNLRGAVTATPFVSNIDYDAKGQREKIVYANGAQTTYTYDPRTLCLTRLRTTRPAAPDATASQLFQDAALVQDLRYTYDPAGNITRIADAALQTVFFGGQQVAPVCAYTYDAVYRLIEATGREQIGQTTHAFNPPGNRRDEPFAGLADFTAHPNDMQALRIYTERYEYDPVGNFQTVRHTAAGGNWTRSYEYTAASLTEPGKQSNRLTRTALGDGTTSSETYTYTDAQGHDVHGCITAINSMAMVWDFEDQLQQVDLGGGGTVFYVYDAGGQRVRKVIENQNGVRKEERIYLGGFEVYRRFGSDALTRETLHIMDDQQRIALVETRTVGDDSLPAQTVRYQLGNHLGSASLELEAGGALVSYEEYHPYGTTAFQAGRSTAEVSLKRYRYTGKERDEETGFAYHGARYYAPWMGRWTSCDPAGLIDGLNLYQYVKAHPLHYVDQHGLQSEPPNGRNPILNRQVGVNEGEQGLIARLKAVGQKIKESSRVIKSGKGGSVIDIRTEHRSFESKVVDIATKSYRKVSGELKESQVARFARRAIRQALRHEKDLKDAGVALKETVVMTVKGAKSQAEVNQVRTIAREAAKKVGGGIKVGVIQSRAGQRGFIGTRLLGGIASNGIAVVTGVLAYRDLKQDLKTKEYGRALASGAGVAASATTVIANAATLFTGVSTSSVGLGTAVGGMGAAKGIAAAPHVVGAFAVGAAVGVGIQEGSAYVSKKYLGTEISPGQIIGDTLSAADNMISKLWSDPSKPAYTQTLGWKIAGWLTPTSR